MYAPPHNQSSDPTHRPGRPVPAGPADKGNLPFVSGDVEHVGVPPVDLFRQELDAARRMRGEAHPSTQTSLRNYTAKLAALKKWHVFETSAWCP